MGYYLFEVWEYSNEEYKKILVKATNLKEADDKINKSNVKFDDYEFIEKVYYDDVVI